MTDYYGWERCRDCDGRGWRGCPHEQEWDCWRCEWWRTCLTCGGRGQVWRVGE